MTNTFLDNYNGKYLPIVIKNPSETLLLLAELLNEIEERNT